MAAFAEATRILFRIIQTTHHLQNTAVSGGRTTPPASLQKKMQELATLILEEHYLENLGHLTKKLENIHLSNWPEAFQVVTRENHGHTTPGPVPEAVASSEADISPRKPGTKTER
ncbi:hypothetical protein SKAU_G00069320 [Synaphobranchus kaupii]|uniref:Uncharacterized protein n=1 Tax=Synaphobranchus kaupii TaxID=118154 RepID=A0A9Q1JBK4_SYNKA|nr:hypothetical protein SKAU_G00069320 [Synaphobranchus kaupii]